MSQTALEYAHRATQLDPSNAEALAIYGHLLSFLHKDVRMALHYFDRALQLNRNLPVHLCLQRGQLLLPRRSRHGAAAAAAVPRADRVAALHHRCTRIRSRSPT
jgi:tetratricopeptide (TPR) repeat protein